MVLCATRFHDGFKSGPGVDGFRARPLLVRTPLSPAGYREARIHALADLSRCRRWYRALPDSEIHDWVVHWHGTPAPAAAACVLSALAHLRPEEAQRGLRKRPFPFRYGGGFPLMRGFRLEAPAVLLPSRCGVHWP